MEQPSSTHLGRLPSPISVCRHAANQTQHVYHVAPVTPATSVATSVGGIGLPKGLSEGMTSIRVPIRFGRLSNYEMTSYPLIDSRELATIHESDGNTWCRNPFAQLIPSDATAARPSAWLARWRIWILLSHRVGVPNLVVILAVIPYFAASASLGEPSRGIMRLSLSVVPAGSFRCPRTLRTPVVRVFVILHVVVRHD